MIESTAGLVFAVVTDDGRVVVVSVRATYDTIYSPLTVARQRASSRSRDDVRSLRVVHMHRESWKVDPPPLLSLSNTGGRNNSE